MDVQISILRICRVFGPLSCADIARKLEMPDYPPDRVYREVKDMERSGLLDHPKKQRWSISDRGHRWLDNHSREGLI